MPEGHTLHRLADALTSGFGGDVVRASSPQGRFREGAARVDGCVLRAASAWGKHLFVRFDTDDGPVVHVHLGLYGKFPIKKGPAPPPVGALRWRLENQQRYADLRGATTCALIDPPDETVLLARLGPDPLRDDADPDRAWARIQRSRSPIGVLVMDQSVLAGVGNVYRAEMLFRHRLNPMMAGSSLRRAEWTAMWTDLVELMGAGARTGRIDAVRPEHRDRLPPIPSRRGGEVYVYRRQGQPCLVCGSKIRTEVLAARNLFWCPGCQRNRRKARQMTTGRNWSGSPKASEST